VPNIQFKWRETIYFTIIDAPYVYLIKYLGNEQPSVLYFIPTVSVIIVPFRKIKSVSSDFRYLLFKFEFLGTILILLNI
jgi:hypothetical protein